jgi:hypothetical protein
LRLTIEGEEALREPHEEEEPEELPGLPLELDHAVADDAVHCGLDQQVWQLHKTLRKLYPQKIKFCRLALRRTSNKD